MKLINIKNMDKKTCGMNLFWILFWILFSIAFLGIGIQFIFNHRNRLSGCSQTVQGTIVELNKRTFSKGRKYTPVVEFAVNGNMVKVTSSLTKSSTSLKVGDNVIVHFNPQTGDMWIEGYDNNFTAYLLGVILAFPGTMIGLLVVLGGILGIRGRILNGLIIFSFIGEITCGLIFIINGIIENTKEMLLPFIAGGIIIFMYIILKNRVKQ